MPITFRSVSDPATELLGAAADLEPENPFFTSAYADGRRTAGEQPWMLSLHEGDRLVAACPAFLSSGWLNRSLEIPSIVADAHAAVFWNGLLDRCRCSGVSHLEVNSYASARAAIPPLPGEIHRTGRTEYLLDLTQPDLWKLLRKGHRWSVNRARKAGLTLRRCRDDAAAYQQHMLMMSASMERRQGRGEVVPEVSNNSPVQKGLALLRCGAGELVQVLRDGEVISSGLVLRSRSGAYYHTAGTRPSGMESGASQFLIFETACALQREGLISFNLGGISTGNPGLREFKLGFGAVPRELESVEVDLATLSRRMLSTAARGLRATLSKMATRT
jgi:Acetyltransferase (GNAT) domain